MARLRWGLLGLGCGWLGCSGVAMMTLGVIASTRQHAQQPVALPAPTPLPAVPPSPAAPYSSYSLRVIDGDTFDMAGTKIRLFGIDAPEAGQPCTNATGVGYDCGAVATQAMNQLVAGQFVTCLPRDKDRYGRTVAVCMAGQVDVGAALVSAGWALAYRQYSMDYVDEEQVAGAGRQGMWAGSFMPPWDYRHAGR